MILWYFIFYFMFSWERQYGLGVVVWKVIGMQLSRGVNIGCIGLLVNKWEKQLFLGECVYDKVDIKRQF